MESFDRTIRSCIDGERPSGTSSVAARVVVPSALQGPPRIGHGGAVASILLELAGRPGGRTDVAAPPHARRLDVALARRTPLDAPLRAAAARAEDGAGAARIEAPDGALLAEATLRDLSAPDAGAALEPPRADDLRRWEASTALASEVPETAMCLVCGRRNPRGLRARLDYDDAFVWKRLDPPDHFYDAAGRLGDGLGLIALDEIGWWLGALAARECGVSTRLAVTLAGEPAARGAPLLLIGSRADTAAGEARARRLRSRAWLLAGPPGPPGAPVASWRAVATAEVTFAASRAFTRSMVGGLFDPGDREAVRRIFPGAG
jgi:hypothetical protein